MRYHARISCVVGIFLAALALGCMKRSEPPSAAPTPPPAMSATSTPAQLAPAADTGAPVDGDWIVSRAPVEPAHLNPLLDTGDAYTQRICSFIFETLLERDNATLELKPCVAESYQTTPDHLSYTFTLRKDVTFSDGVALTANDVKFTIDTIMDPANETADKRNYYQDVEKTEVLDDYTIRFTCKKPYFQHPSAFGEMMIYPKHIYGSESINTHSRSRSPLGSGPYLFEKWTTNQEIVLKRNPNYWNKAKQPHLDKLVYRIITDDNSALQALERGELDSMGLMPEQWVNRAGAPEFEAKFNKFTTWARPGYIGFFNYMAWNLRKPVFEDKRVRRALTMLLDRQTILETIFHNLGKVVSGSEFSESLEYDTSIAPWPFDPEAAKKLLDEAGWVDSDKDGIRDKNGAPLKFDLMIPASTPEYEQLATVFKEELDRTGVSMTILQREWATLLEGITKRSFDAFIMGWAIPVDSDPYQLWHSSQVEKGSNYPGFVNPEVDKLCEDIRVEFDRQKRIPMFHRFHAIMHDEQPYTFLFNMQSLLAVDKRFENVIIYPQGADLREWWAPKDKRRYK